MSTISIQNILDNINASPTPFHAVNTITTTLVKNGFEVLQEGDSWQIKAGGRYCMVRDFSSFIAFIVPNTGLGEIPQLRLAAAHTDSPTLKIKPNPLKEKKKHLVWDVEIYGSPILSTWFDRDLSLAGLVGFTDSTETIQHRRIDFNNSLARIPNLAIHLNREANKGYAPKLHDELNPIFAPLDQKMTAREHFDKLLKNKLVIDGHGQLNELQILDWNLSFYDRQPAQPSGWEDEWVVGARLDNLLSCFIGLEALESQTDDKNLPMLACFDHEEVGSMSATGAAGNFIEAVLRRLLPEEEKFSRTMAHAQMVSVDNAHAYHPNFPGKQDDNDPPTLGNGIAVKYNANQRYTTNTMSGSWFQALCKQNNIPLQNFTARSDMPCGSTIGPTLSARLGLSALDIGIPTWAMHSIRETAGSRDIHSLYRLWSRFYSSRSPDKF
jgi:aspartyl aminopeptidase